jgi:L-alanine-DL-glutamate epimerase-like enolase superfamily enzyme
VSVISGIDIALWDIKGKALGVPVHTLLGGLMHERMPVYASIGGSPDDLDEAVTSVRRWVDEGFRAVKLGQFSNGQFGYDTIEGVYVHRPVTAEFAADAAARFQKLRDAFGPKVDLIIHNHMGSQAWPLPMNLNEATRVLQALEPVGLLFAEEPLPYEDIAGYADLRQRTTTPIAGGEMLSGLHEFAAFINARALDIVQPDVSFCGGITTTWAVMQLASANFIRTALHMGGSFGPAYAAGLHLSFAHRDAIILETLPVAMPLIREVLQFPLELVDGSFGPPPLDVPGLGVEISDDVLRRHPFAPGSGERG